MEITDVRVYPVRDEKVRAFVSIVFDRCFMVNDIKVIQGKDGLFVSMPSRKRKSGEFKDVAHPLNSETRRWVEERILAVYQANLDGVGASEGARRAVAADLTVAAPAMPAVAAGAKSARRAVARRGRAAAVRRLLLGRHLSSDDRLAGRQRSRAVRGASPSGKARDFGSRIRRFESSRPNQVWQS